MAVSKVIVNGVTKMDATGATAAAADIIAPKTAMLADGEVTPGTGSRGSGMYTKLIDWTAEEDVMSVQFTEGDNNEVLKDCTEIWLLMLVCPQENSTYTSGIKMNFGAGTSVWSGHYLVGYGIASTTTGSMMYVQHYLKTPMGILCDTRIESYNNGSSIKTGTLSEGKTVSPTGVEYSGLENGSKNIGADLDLLIADDSFTKIQIGGYQTVIGTGSQIRVWGR